MRRKSICQFMLIVLIPVLLQTKAAFPQGTDRSPIKNKNPDSSGGLISESIKNAVKEGIKESGEEKERKDAQFLSELKSKFNAKVQEWIVFSKHKRDAELNKLRHTDWDLGGLINYPVPYDYYLRGFDYSTTGADIKTGSLLSPYKASINISEKLYVEATHSSEATDVRKYYYTLTRVIVLNLEYEQNKFTITNTDYGPFQIEYGWKKN